MSFLKRILPEDRFDLQFMAIAVTIVICISLVLIGIYWLGEYGMALFLIVPFNMGFIPVVIVGLRYDLSRKERWQLILYTGTVVAVLVILFAIEGLVCLLMAAPLVALISFGGAELAAALLFLPNERTKKSIAWLLVASGFPLAAALDSSREAEVHSVSTSIEINAGVQEIWDLVIAFPPLDEPDEFIFKTGISYPINASIDGQGVGAIRECNFTTGSFVEPVTEWNEPRLLAFDVVEQPAPMKELSFWDINAPHLHDFFVSQKGQFKLTPNENGTVTLEGTTWYKHNMYPEWYWGLWSDYIIHKIHFRVLDHIRKLAEKSTLHPTAKRL